MGGNDTDRKHRLEEILQREDHDDHDDNDSTQGTAEDIAKADSAQMDEDLAAAQATAEGFCVECKDQESFYSCEQCAEEFCEVCYGNTFANTSLFYFFYIRYITFKHACIHSTVVRE